MAYIFDQGICVKGKGHRRYQRESAEFWGSFVANCGCFVTKSACFVREFTAFVQ